MEQNENQSFTYTYSATKQSEIKRIREKYIPQETDKMEILRNLDQSVTQKGMTVSLCIGIIGALIIVMGISYTILWSDKMFILGIIIDIIGIIAVVLAYPLYTKTIKKERERIAPEILRLTDELMKKTI